MPARRPETSTRQTTTKPVTVPASVVEIDQTPPRLDRPVESFEPGTSTPPARVRAPTRHRPTSTLTLHDHATPDALHPPETTRPQNCTTSTHSRSVIPPAFEGWGAVGGAPGCGGMSFRAAREGILYGVYAGEGSNPCGTGIVPPRRSPIERALSHLDLSFVDSDATASGIADAAVLVVSSGATQHYSDPCGIWTLDGHLVRCVRPSERPGPTVGQVADTAGRLLGQRLVPRSEPEVVTNGQGLLATIRYGRGAVTIEQPPPAASWSCRYRYRPGIWTVSSGDLVIAAGRATQSRMRWLLWDDMELTTVITLHPALDLDQRVVILFVLLTFLGPPTGEPV